MHVMLRGQAHGRHFDRVHDEPNHITIRPTLDEVLGPGAVTTISDRRWPRWSARPATQVAGFSLLIAHRQDGITPGDTHGLS
jgi:hypothetical protein